MVQEKIESGLTGKQINPQQPKKNSAIGKRIKYLIRDFIAIFFWAYIVVKLFIFDIDIYIVKNFLPNYEWLLNFKFFIVIGIVAIIWLITKNRQILIWSLYIFFFPFIVLFWKIPFFIFKQKSWILVFAFFDAIISFFKSIKSSFITSAFFLVSVAIIFSSSNVILLWSSIGVMLGIVLFVFINKVVMIFKPSGVYQKYAKIFTFVGNSVTSLYLPDEGMTILPIESLDEKQIQKWTTNVQILVMFNRICLFVARKLKIFQVSGFNIISSVLTILVLIVFTIFSFAVINHALFKINSHLFAFSVNPTFFTFFYYSFNNLLFNSIPDIISVTPLSQSISMTESFFALFLIVIFVSLMLSVKSQRLTDELNDAIKNLEEQGKKMESFIREKYKLNSIEDALIVLQKLEAGMVTLLYKITESIR